MVDRVDMASAYLAVVDRVDMAPAYLAVVDRVVASLDKVAGKVVDRVPADTVDFVGIVNIHLDIRSK